MNAPESNETISWQEAIREAGDLMRSLKARHSPASLRLILRAMSRLHHTDKLTKQVSKSVSTDKP